MQVETKKLMTLHNWAKQWTREIPDHGKPVLKTGCSAQHAHELFNPDNHKPVALRVREEWQLLTIDGIKFVIKISDIQKRGAK
jgi:hypothetical protein